MTFSRGTIFEAMVVLETTSDISKIEHASLDRFLLKFSLEGVAPESIGSVKKRINALMKYFIDNPIQAGPQSSNLLFDVVEEILHKRISNKEYIPHFPKLLNSLELDGYSVDSAGNLTQILPSTVQISEKKDELELLLDSFQFTVAKGHFQQAIDAHTRGNWAGANSQLRPFVESLFTVISVKLGATPTKEFYTNGKFLTELSPPFLLESLNEWTIGSNSGFMQGFWKRLHPEGSHQGLSDQEDSTFRLQTVILVAHQLLKRLENRLQNP